MSQSTSPERRAARARADAAWADLRDRLHTITPAALGRSILTVITSLVVAAAVVGTWPTLLPFVLGGLIAYAVLPVVDGLDRLMPRALAASLAMLGVVALVVAVLAIVLPPLISAIIEVSRLIPSSSELGRRLDELLAALPEDGRAVLAPIALEVLRAVDAALAGATSGLGGLVPAALQAALGVVGAMLGLIVLPVWMLTLLTERQRSRLAIDRHAAGWLRADLWAIIHMLDRAVGTYLRGYVVVAFLVGVATYVGLSLSERVGGPTYNGELALATFAGAVQVIPEIGPLFGLLPALLLLPIDPARAGVYVLVYIAARIVVGRTIGDRLMEGRLDIPPIILIPGVVVLGQVGPILLLLSAPILAFGTDLVRYLHGRLSEPPRPAGVLPGQPLPTPAATMARPATPVVYRSRTTSGRRPAASEVSPYG